MNSPFSASPATALRSAAAFGELPEIRRLVLEGTDVNVWDRQGWSALTFACALGNLDLVDFLIEHGAWVDPHEDYDTYDTPLIAAAWNGHLEVVMRLLRAGANAFVYGGTWQVTAECYARRRGHDEIAAYLRSVMGW